MPPHARYIEPFAGGLQLLLARDPEDERLWYPGAKGMAEIVNDLDGRIARFWRVMRLRVRSGQNALALFVLVRQSLGG
jgi:DNA adenine methylase